MIPLPNSRRLHSQAVNSHALVAYYENSLIFGIPSKRIIVRNTGERNITISRFVAQRIYSLGYGLGPGAYTLDALNKDRTLYLSYLEDSELRFNSPISVEPGASVALDVDLDVTRGGQTDSGGSLGFALYIEYYNGAIKLLKLEGFYELSDQYGNTTW